MYCIESYTKEKPNNKDTRAGNEFTRDSGAHTSHTS